MTHKLTKKEWFAGNCSRLHLSEAHTAEENAVLFWNAFHPGGLTERHPCKSPHRISGASSTPKPCKSDDSSKS